MQTLGGRKASVLVAFPLVAAVLCVVLHALWVVTGSERSIEPGVDWVYNGAMIFAGMACVGRAACTRAMRGAWIAFGLGLMAWGLGDVYWQNVLQEMEQKPYPSLADVGYLLALPCFFVGIALLIKRRMGHFSVASWFDGAIGALAAAAVATAFLEPVLVGLTNGEPAAVLTNLAYPLGDLILIAFLAGSLVISGLRGAGVMVLVGAGLIAFCVADVIYLYQEATTGYGGGWMDSLWIVGGLLIAIAAALSPSLGTRRQELYRSSRHWPAFFTLTAAALLLWDHFSPRYELAIWLAGGTIAAVVMRLWLSFRENDRLMAALRCDAVTDQLTGLGNRRRLLEDLERVFEQDGGNGQRHLFALYDLDGFKAYNDTFGHPAGDALLARLGSNLRDSVAHVGTAYRLGGDEFCIVAKLGTPKPASLFEMSRAALCEEGEGFSIGASGAWVRLPDDAKTASDALRIADQRMYAEKNLRSSRAAIQTREVLMRIFREGEPALSVHVEGVAGLARQIGRRLGFDSEELDVLGRAADLHDIGKIAIPDDILHKEGPLNALEWELMRRHTVIGARILDAAPAMRRVAEVVRSSHERWDGKGYPDRLAGNAIPLASRIIFICDSFDAMTRGRPYKSAVSPEEAIVELRGCAGTQFDPDLVQTFCEMIDQSVLEGGTALI